MPPRVARYGHESGKHKPAKSKRRLGWFSHHFAKIGRRYENKQVKAEGLRCFPSAVYSGRQRRPHKAVQFYIDHLTAEDQRSMLPNAMLSSMKSIVAESDNRICRLLFKLAVQLAVTMNVVAANSEIDDVSLERLKGECVKEVKRLNGNFTFKDANDWQKG